jgi:hypothetical protein
MPRGCHEAILLTTDVNAQILLVAVLTQIVPISDISEDRGALVVTIGIGLVAKFGCDRP